MSVGTRWARISSFTAFVVPKRAAQPARIAWGILALCSLGGCTGKRFDPLPDSGTPGVASSSAASNSSSDAASGNAPPDATSTPPAPSDSVQNADAAADSGAPEPTLTVGAEAGAASTPTEDDTLDTGSDDASSTAVVSDDAPEIPGEAGADAGCDAATCDAGEQGADASLSDAATDAAQPDAALGDAATDASPSYDADTPAPVDAWVGPIDDCPEHPSQSEAGVCGCGFTPSADCAELGSELAHRYSFDGSGSVAYDRVGDADAEISGVELTGSGVLDLGGDEGYVTLPSDVATATSSATYEVWLKWYGGVDWQRIFDFGNRTGLPPSPRTYIYLSPRSGTASGDQALMVAYSFNGSGSTTHLHAPEPLPVDQLVQVAVVVDAADDELLLYLNGEEQASRSFNSSLSSVVDETNRLGRSLFSDDPYLNASLYEFRIYGSALSAEQLALSFELGPDAPLGN